MVCGVDPDAVDRWASRSCPRQRAGTQRGPRPAVSRQWSCPGGRDLSAEPAAERLAVAQGGSVAALGRWLPAACRLLAALEGQLAGCCSLALDPAPRLPTAAAAPRLAAGRLRSARFRRPRAAALRGALQAQLARQWHRAAWTGSLGTKRVTVACDRHRPPPAFACLAWRAFEPVAKWPVLVSWSNPQDAIQIWPILRLRQSAATRHG